MTCGKKTKHTTRIGCCALCGELFSGDSAFQKHRGSGPTCTDPGEVGLIAKPSRTAPGEVIWSHPPAKRDPWARDDEDVYAPALTPAAFSERLRALGRDGGER